MLQVGSWFSKPRSNSKEEVSQPTEDGAASTTTDLGAGTKHDTEPPHSYTNPHDAVLADLYGLTASPSGDNDSSSTKLPFFRSTAVEPLYDPFNGSKLGTLHPPFITDEPAEIKNEELWRSLSTVLDLQSEISTMHLHMEGVGNRAKKPTSRLNERKGKKNRKGAAGDGDNVEEVDDVRDDNDDDPAGDVEEEFETVTQDFASRRHAIDSIMEKLDDLSEALTNFHQLRTPALNLTSTHADDKQSLPKTTSPAFSHTPNRTTFATIPESRSAPAATSAGPPPLSIDTQMLPSALGVTESPFPVE